MFKLDQEDPTHRAAFALIVVALTTFMIWGLWTSIAFVIGAAGWLAETFGGWMTALSGQMLAVHMIVAWVAIGGGAILGAIVAFNIPLDRLTRRSKRENPHATTR